MGRAVEWGTCPSGTKLLTPTCYCSCSLVLLTLVNVSLTTAFICCPYQHPPALLLLPKAPYHFLLPVRFGVRDGKQAPRWGWEAPLGTCYGPADTDEEEEGVLLMDDADSLVRG